MRQFVADKRAGAVDARGAGPLGYWIGDGVIYCLLRAPTRSAAYQHHLDHRLTSEGMRTMVGVPQAASLMPDDLATVAAFIQRAWH